VKTPLALLLFLLAPLAWLTWRGICRGRARGQAIRELLDAADALEARLRTARGEIEAVAGDHENPVQGAMRDVLRQRLWLRDHAADASIDQLHAVRSSLDAAREHLEMQLVQIDQARIRPAGNNPARAGKA
jgi:DNA-binding FrmR family transcriptional regulator